MGSDSGIKTFRKKHVVVQALRWDGRQRDMFDFLTGTENQDMVIEGEHFRIEFDNGPGTLGTLVIKTLEGEMRAAAGDWIIKGVNGEYYPCKPDIFEKTYEKDENVILGFSEMKREPKKLAIGDKVAFTLAPDIPAIVVDVVSNGVGEEYLVAWFDNAGLRQTGYVKQCEVRKLFAGREAEE